LITDGFKLGNGLKQVDGLAPNLFNIALKYVIRLLSVQVKFTIFYISLQLTVWRLKTHICVAPHR